MISLLLATASAITNIPLTLCFDYDIQYEEGGNGYTGPGDYWVNNNIDRPARWQFIEVSSGVSSISIQLNSAGCVSFNLGFPDANHDIRRRFDVTLLSKGYRRGSHLIMRNNQNDTDVYFKDRPLMSETFTHNWVAGAGGTFDYVLPATDGWQHFAAAMTALDRNGWRLSYGPGRDCCVPGAAGLDGTCNDPNSFYDKSFEPYGPAGSQYIAILVLNGNRPPKPDGTPGTSRSNSCCSSKITWEQGLYGRRSGIGAGENVQSRFSISHEEGHVMVGLRMGHWEANMYPSDAPHDGCNADHLHDGTPLPKTERGIYQKEYMGVSFREGWGDFFSAWVWNSPGGADVEYPSGLYFDYDMDGDLDNDAAGWPYQEAHRIMGTPEIPGEPGGTSPAPWVANLSENWLDAAITNVASCTEVEPSYRCTIAEAATMESINRSTVRDASSLFWGLFTEEGLSPNELSNLYVDMCPRAWRRDDGEAAWWDEKGHYQPPGPDYCADLSDLPYHRLEDSAAHNQVLTELYNQSNRVVH